MSIADALSEGLPQHYQTAIDAVCEIAEAYYRLGKLEAALSALQAGTLLLDQDSAQPLDESRTKLLLQQGKLLATQGFYANSGYDAAVSALRRAQDRAAATGDEGSGATALHLLGLADYNKALIGGAGDYEQAFEYFQQALARREALQDRRGVAESLFYSGLIYERWKQTDEARGSYMKALAIAKEHGYALEHSYALRHLASLAQDAGDLAQALALFSESLALREAAGYKILLPLSHLAVGDVLLAQNGMDPEKHYWRAYALSQEMDIPVAQIFCLLSIGSVYHQDHELAQARSYFEQALASAQEIDFSIGKTEASRALEEIARQENGRATITVSAEARGRYIKQTSGPGNYGDVWLRVEPLERGNGFEFVNALAQGVIPDMFVPAIEAGVREAMASGGPGGYPLVDMRVTLFNGAFHEVDSRAMDFKIAAAMALKAAVEQAQPIVLEP